MKRFYTSYCLIFLVLFLSCSEKNNNEKINKYYTPCVKKHNFFIDEITKSREDGNKDSVKWIHSIMCFEEEKLVRAKEELEKMYFFDFKITKKKDFNYSDTIFIMEFYSQKNYTAESLCDEECLLNFIYCEEDIDPRSKLLGFKFYN